MNNKRVAIVTGGTQGIGLSISKTLAQQGIAVVAVYKSNFGVAAQADEILNEIDADCCVIKGDVSQNQDVENIISLVIKKYGRVDILVNNAGIFDFAYIQDITEEYIENIMNVNFKSQVLMTRAVIPHMKKLNNGRIIGASSISSSIADVGLVGYGCSKAAVDMFIKIASAELAPYNITVNGYAPGIAHTEMTDSMIKQRGKEQVKQIPLNRFGTCEEVADLVAFLASDKSAYITGAIIPIDGGFCKVQNPHRAHEYCINLQNNV